MHLGLAEADQTFLRWVLRGQRSWLIRRHCPSRTPWCKPTGILSPALDSATRGLLTGLAYKSLVGVAPVQDPAFCSEARPCQRRELPSEGKGTTAAPPAVTSKCSCTGCRRRTTIRSRPRKKSSLRSSVGTGSSVQISTSAGRHGSSKASATSARRSRPPPRKKFGWRSTGTATRPTAFGLSKASARTRRPARCSVGSSNSRLRMRTSFRAQERLDHRRDSRERDRGAQPACDCRSPLHCAQQGRNSGRREGNANMGQPIGLHTPCLHRAGKGKRVRPAKWVFAFNPMDAKISASGLIENAEPRQIESGSRNDFHLPRAVSSDNQH